MIFVIRVKIDGLVLTEDFDRNIVG